MRTTAQRLAVLAAVLTLSLQPAAQNREDKLDACVRLTGGPSRSAFVEFDRELKAALEANDTASLALLVDFPLRLNMKDSSEILLGNPPALQSRFNEAFPPRVRATIRDQKTSDVSCTDDGIMFGQGDVWIHAVGEGAATHYAVFAINVDTANPGPSSLPARVRFACNAERHRVLVDTTASSELRYRAWNRPRSILEKPDLELLGGKLGYEGSQTCTRRLWKFVSGRTEFIVGEQGRCGDGSAPQGAVGTLEVVTDDRTRLQSWCF